MSAISLYSGPPLADHLAKLTREAAARAASLPSSAWDFNGIPDLLSDATVAEEVAGRFALAWPELDWAALSLRPVEAKILMSERTAKFEHNISQVRGVRVEASIPYSGDAVLLRCTPRAHHVGGFVRGVRYVEAGRRVGQIVTAIEGREAPDQEIIEHVLSEVSDRVEAYRSFVATDLAHWQRHLLDVVLAEVMARRRFLNEVASLESRLLHG